IVAITVAGLSFVPDYEFFAGNLDGSANLDEQIEPLYQAGPSFVGTYDTDSGSRDFYTRLYVVEQATHPFGINIQATDPVALPSFALLGIGGLVEIGPTGDATLLDPATEQTIPAATGGLEDVNGLWLLAAFPAGNRESGDFTLIDWPEPQQGNDNDAGNAGAP